MKKLFVVLSLLLVVMLLVTACGPKATPAPEPTAAPAAAVEPTKAPATEPTKAPEPTAPPKAAEPTAGTITLWHGWTGAEADTLAEVITAFQAANPGVTLETLAVPFDQLKNKYTTEASTGGGPDLLIGPKDWIGELSQANLIMPLDDVADKVGLNNLEPVGGRRQQVRGQGVGVPGVDRGGGAVVQQGQGEGSAQERR